MASNIHEQPKSKVFAVNVLQGRDELEDKLEKCCHTVMNITPGLSERESHDALNQMVCKGVKEHEEVCLGLFYIILTEPPSAPKAYRDLSFISRDGLSLVVTKIHQILAERFQKLMDAPKGQMNAICDVPQEKGTSHDVDVKNQVLWIVGEMMKNQVPNLEPVMLLLFRLIAGGDHSATNIWLIENVLKLLNAHRAWLDKNPSSLQLCIYTYLRIIEDHENPRFKNLRQLEVDFIVQLIREKFPDCLSIGRDFVRLLQNVFRIPEFMKLWKDILFRPQSLAQQFTGLPQLLNVRTSRKFLASRVTPDMENKLAFLALKVKFGLQKRYQEWFFRQYLSNPESQTLLPDLMRFICGVIHPPNEILASEVIPRWAIVGWLYTTCQNPVTQTNMKLALFYDWLFYQGEKDNIMNIGKWCYLKALASKFRVSKLPNVAFHRKRVFSNDVDVKIQMSSNYCPQFVNITKQGLYQSFRNILDKRVVSSLSPILKSSRMDKELKQLIQEALPSFVRPDRNAPQSSSDDSNIPKTGSPPLSPSSDAIKEFTLPTDTSSMTLEANDESSTDEAVFSDEDEEEKSSTTPPPPPPPLPSEKSDKVFPPLPATSTAFRPISIKEEDFETKVEEAYNASDDITELEEFQNLDSNLLKDNVMKLKTEKEESSKAEAMEAIISNIESMGDFDDEIATPLCVCLAHCLSDDLSLPALPDEMNEKSIEMSLERPQHVIFRSICSLSKNDINRENLYVLLNGIHEIDQKIGYHLLYFIKACYNDEEKLSVYEDFVGYFKDRTLKTVLTQDLKEKVASLDVDVKNQACHEYDPALFMYLIEMMFKHFKDVTVGNKEIIRMLVATLHPDEMSTIITSITLGQLSIIGENQVGGLLGNLVHLHYTRTDSRENWAASFSDRNNGRLSPWRRDISECNTLKCLSTKGTTEDLKELIGLLNKQSSLSWSSFEQACLWQLIIAEETPIEMLVGILPMLKLPKHSETINHLLLQVRAESPQMEIIKPALCMDLEGSGKRFSLCLFKTWSQDEARELAHVFAQLLTKPATHKRTKGKSSASHNPTLDQIVLHLNQYYQFCQDTNDMALFKYESLRYAVTQAKKNVSNAETKAKCKSLFAEFNELPSRNNRKRKSQRVTRSNRGARNLKEDSSEESESDEEDEESESDEDEGDDEEEELKLKPRPPSRKRRKSSKNVSSDEDD